MGDGENTGEYERAYVVQPFQFLTDPNGKTNTMEFIAKYTPVTQEMRSPSLSTNITVKTVACFTVNDWYPYVDVVLPNVFTTSNGSKVHKRTWSVDDTTKCEPGATIRPDALAKRIYALFADGVANNSNYRGGRGSNNNGSKARYYGFPKPKGIEMRASYPLHGTTFNHVPTEAEIQEAEQRGEKYQLQVAKLEYFRIWFSNPSAIRSFVSFLTEKREQEIIKKGGKSEKRLCTVPRPVEIPGSNGISVRFQAVNTDMMTQMFIARKIENRCGWFLCRKGDMVTNLIDRKTFGPTDDIRCSYNDFAPLPTNLSHLEFRLHAEYKMLSFDIECSSLSNNIFTNAAKESDQAFMLGATYQVYKRPETRQLFVFVKDDSSWDKKEVTHYSVRKHLWNARIAHCEDEIKTQENIRTTATHESHIEECNKVIQKFASLAEKHRVQREKEETEDGNFQDKIEIVWFTTYKDMMEKFAELIRDLDVELVYGYNTIGFDIPYLAAKYRMESFSVSKTGVEFPTMGRFMDQPSKVVPVKSGKFGSMECENIKMDGRLCIDVMMIMRVLFQGNQGGHSMETMARKLLKSGKIDFPVEKINDTWNKKDSALLAECAAYCLHDTIVCMNMFETVDAVTYMIESSNQMRISPEELLSSGQVMKLNRIFFEKLGERGYIFNERFAEFFSVTGGYVLKPAEGVYFFLSTLDFKSLYPSIMIGHGLSPNTVAHPSLPPSLCDEYFVPVTFKEHMCPNPAEDEVGADEKQRRLDVLHQFLRKPTIVSDPLPAEEPTCESNEISKMPTTAESETPDDDDDEDNETDETNEDEFGAGNIAINDNGEKMQYVSRIQDPLSKKWYFYVRFIKAGHGVPPFFAIILRNLLNLRADIVKRMKQMKKAHDEGKEVLDDVMYGILDQRQKAIKALANSIYGYCIAWYALGKCVEVGMVTTFLGREYNKLIQVVSREHGLKAVYGDTDSNMITPIEKMALDIFKKRSEMVASEVTRRIGRDPICLEVENVFFAFILEREKKKQYCGVKFLGKTDLPNKDPREMYQRGRTQRADRTKWMKRICDTFNHNVIHNGWKFNDFRDFVFGEIEKLRKGLIPLSELSITMKYNPTKTGGVMYAFGQRHLRIGRPFQPNESISYVISREADMRFEEIYAGKKKMPAGLKFRRIEEMAAEIEAGTNDIDHVDYITKLWEVVLSLLFTLHSTPSLAPRGDDGNIIPWETVKRDLDSKLDLPKKESKKRAKEDSEKSGSGPKKRSKKNAVVADRTQKSLTSMFSMATASNNNQSAKPPLGFGGSSSIKPSASMNSLASGLSNNVVPMPTDFCQSRSMDGSSSNRSMMTAFGSVLTPQSHSASNSAFGGNHCGRSSSVFSDTSIASIAFPSTNSLNSFSSSTSSSIFSSTGSSDKQTLSIAREFLKTQIPNETIQIQKADGETDSVPKTTKRSRSRSVAADSAAPAPPARKRQKKTDAIPPRPLSSEGILDMEEDSSDEDESVAPPAPHKETNTANKKNDSKPPASAKPKKTPGQPSNQMTLSGFMKTSAS